jgi:hypothetical protein
VPTRIGLEPPAPPSDEFVRRRYIPAWRVQWVEQCDRIMIEYGAVYGSSVYPERHLARWRAKWLVKVMVELGLHERWQLIEHTQRRDTGWIWSVEYAGMMGAPRNNT